MEVAASAAAAAAAAGFVSYVVAACTAPWLACISRSVARSWRQAGLLTSRPGCTKLLHRAVLATAPRLMPPAGNCSCDAAAATAMRCWLAPSIHPLHRLTTSLRSPGASSASGENKLRSSEANCQPGRMVVVVVHCFVGQQWQLLLRLIARQVLCLQPCRPLFVCCRLLPFAAIRLAAPGVHPLRAHVLSSTRATVYYFLARPEWRAGGVASAASSVVSQQWRSLATAAHTSQHISSLHRLHCTTPCWCM